MNKNINIGDDVRHKNPIINGGFAMTVKEIDINKSKVCCFHFAGSDGKHTTDWFDILDLVVVYYGKSYS